jgi:hypothetical protein
MPTEMDHTYLQELLPQYTAHSLSETVHQQVEAHLAGCAVCRANLGEWCTIIDTLRDELAELPPDTAQERSWNMLRAHLVPQPSILEPVRISTSANAESFLNEPGKSPSAAVTRGPAYQRWLGFVSAIAAAFIILASLALFGTLGRMNSTGTSSAIRTVVVPTVSTATTNAPAATATHSADSTPTGGVNTARFVCTGSNSGITWAFNPCPLMVGQAGTLTISAPAYPNTGTNVIVNFGNCPKGDCTIDDPPAQGFKTNANGVETISFVVARDVQVGGPPATGEINLSGGPTAGINTQGSCT